MKRRRHYLMCLCVPSLTLATLALLASACGDDDDVVGATTPDGSSNQDQQSGSDTSQSSTDAPTDQAASDGGADTSLPVMTLAKFNPANFELAEGVTTLKADGTPVVGFAPLGKVVKILVDGGTTDFANFGSATNFYTLGLASDATGNVYIAVAQTGANPSVQPGIYKVPPTGGTPVVFATPPIGSAFGFVNGLDFVDTDLYATDSTGKIFKVSSLGISTKWLEDSTLAGDEQDCKLGNGFPIGVNGITHDNDNIYVVNTDKGTLLKIPRGGGDAGTVSQIVKDPQLCGADGLVIDKDGTFLIAVNAKDAIVRVTSAGAITTLVKGAPLDSPASLWIDTSGGARKLLITNASFRSIATDGGKPAPSLVFLPLAN